MVMSVPVMPLKPMISLWISTSAGSSITSPRSVLDEPLVLVLLQLALQRAQADAEDVGGARPVAGGAAQGLEDGLALDVVHGARLADDGLHGRAAGGESRRIADLGRQVVERDLAVLVEDHHRLHHVLELAHVARPRVAAEQLERPRR